MLSLPGHRVEQFWAKVDKNGPIPKDRPELGRCWEWTGTRGTRGYGRFEVLTASGTKTKRHRRLLQAHKVAYELLVAPVPDGLPVDKLRTLRDEAGVAGDSEMVATINAVLIGE